MVEFRDIAIPAHIKATLPNVVRMNYAVTRPITLVVETSLLTKEQFRAVSVLPPPEIVYIDSSEITLRENVSGKSHVPPTNAEIRQAAAEAIERASGMFFAAPNTAASNDDNIH